MKKGDRVIAFADRDWRKVGDIDDNSQFYKPATILDLRTTDNKHEVADILFDHDPIESKGHFVTHLRKIPQ